MGIVSVPSFGSDPATITASGLDGKVDPLVTEFNGNIENVNIKSGAAITYSKLSLTDSILNADINSSAQVAASKLNLNPVAQTLGMSGKQVRFAKGSDIASASSVDFEAATGNVVDITGTTTITALGTVQAGTIMFVEFDGALTLTHNATSLILPTAANITTAAGDCAIFQSEGSGNWRCMVYQRKDGTALAVSTSSNQIIQTRITQSSAVAQSTGTAVMDDTTPTTTETPVVAALNTAITASSGSNSLLITVTLNVSIDSSANQVVVSVFKDADANAIAATSWLNSGSLTDSINPVTLQFYVSATDTSAHTYKVGVGHIGGGVVTINGTDGSRKFGGVLYSSMRIDEIKA